MKRIYVIAIAFLASWTVISAKKNFDQNESEKTIPTICIWSNGTTHLAHENDCTKFYKCDYKKEKAILDCPLDKNKNRMHFNRREQVCDWPWHAGCTHCPGNKENGFPRSKISHETDDCHQYYECINGEKQLRQCPSGWCFSRTCQDCVRNRANGNCN